MTAAEPVGIQEVAERLGVKHQTVRAWRVLGALPPAWAELAVGPVWKWSTIRQWARDTGRLPEQKARKALRAAPPG